MTGENRLTLAVAGGRKTQSIIDACVESPMRRLVVTFTTNGQEELRGRLGETCGAAAPEVMGWYSFLISHFVRPYLPAVYPGRTIDGFNFDHVPDRYASGVRRHFDGEGRLSRGGLSSLSGAIVKATGGLPYDRLAHIYQEICIDEVQDLTGWDLEILNGLLSSGLRVTLVGDLRQSVYDTNPQDQKLKQYRGLAMLQWFQEAKAEGRLNIEEVLENWRCVPEIVELSNAVIPEAWGFQSAVSRQIERRDHQGVFRVAPSQIADYVRTHAPLALRWSSASGKDLEHLCQFDTMGKVKGITVDNVLIYPTTEMVKFLVSGVSKLKGQAACKLYVGITRARFSVAFILDPKVATPGLTSWSGVAP